jgi:catechol 2,3-dioxygenase-like lactoylglutathione lyase family enzyme
MTSFAGIDHVTLRCAQSQLASVQAFYETVLGLQSGQRPSFDFAGSWLYSGSQAVVHLAVVLDKPLAGDALQVSSRPQASAATGYIDHFALRATLGIDEVRENLRSLDVPFSEEAVPDMPLHQIFLVDPLGVKIELNFLVT